MDKALLALCLTVALKTLDTNTLDILESEERIPVTINTEEGRLARPTRIGKDYRTGGVMLVDKNPGGGSPSFGRARPSWDLAFFDALIRLRNERDMA